MVSPIPIAVPVETPAKINLHLGVGPLRKDGYHELVTVFQALNITDSVVAEAARSGLSIEVWAGVDEVEAQAVPNDETNLAYQAAALLQRECGVKKGAKLSIEKNIPVAGGMAGGSSDAAGALLACNALWGLDLSLSQLTGYAAELGSDVPFALHGGTALGSSRGEVLTPVLTTGTFHWVVATSFRQLSTAAVYAQYDKLKKGSKIPNPEIPAELMSALRQHDLELLGHSLYNDLQQAAVSLMPELDLLLESGIDYGALGAMISGSGPTCVFLARDHEHSIELALALSTTGLCSAARLAQGPAPGARIITAPPDLTPVVIENPPGPRRAD